MEEDIEERLEVAKEITRAVLLAKLAGYEGAIGQLQAQLTANQGAAAAIRALLKTMDEPETLKTELAKES